MRSALRQTEKAARPPGPPGKSSNDSRRITTWRARPKAKENANRDTARSTLPARSRTGSPACNCATTESKPETIVASWRHPGIPRTLRYRWAVATGSRRDYLDRVPFGHKLEHLGS